MRVMHHETVTATLRDHERPPEVDVHSQGLIAHLTLPISLGGQPQPGATNPEQLFGSAYAGCMVFAVEHAMALARRDRAEVAGLRITAEVRIGRAADRTNRLEVDLHISLPALDQADAEALCREATRYCPFHQALEGNVGATLTVSGAAAQP